VIRPDRGPGERRPGDAEFGREHLMSERDLPTLIVCTVPRPGPDFRVT
jgi:hypothetical protein